MSQFDLQVPCKVTSAAPLSDDHLESLKGALGSFLKPNEKLLLDTAVSYFEIYCPLPIGKFIIGVLRFKLVLIGHILNNAKFQTDASLIGGMVVEIGDKRVDMSTASKIKKLKTALSLPL